MRKPRGWIELSLLFVILLLADAPLQSQQAQQGQPTQQTQQAPQTTSSPQTAQAPPISVNVKEVSMLATVRDKKGALVSNLTKDDFVLEQDGHPETITYFAKETDLPLTLGLLVDTSMSQRTVLGQERDASHSFLDHAVREDKDKAFVIHFDSEVELLQDLTSSRAKLEASLDSLGAPQFSQTRGGGGGGQSGGGGGGGGYGGRGGRGGYGGAGTLLYDAVYLASNELMKKQQGRKALIVLTDGVDRGSKETLLSSIETAQRADTLVYSILFTGEEGGGYGNRGGGFGGPRMGGMGGGGMGGGHRGYPQESRTDGKKVLQQLSAETGGRFFEVTKKLTIDQIYTAIDEELRNQYSLGYALDMDTDSGYHKLQLTTKNKDLAVQTREGFYANR